MSGIIRDFYYGRLIPAEQLEPRDGAYMEVNQEILDAQGRSFIAWRRLRRR